MFVYSLNHFDALIIFLLLLFSKLMLIEQH